MSNEIKIRYAVDENNEKTFVDDVKDDHCYYCPICRSKVIPKRGDIRVHHFAHERKCTDTWSHDMSEWHINWQSHFNNIEVVMELGEKRHIADAVVGDYVIEFQHSPIKLTEFRDRNDFYSELGYKVIWIFDLYEKYKQKQIYFKDFYHFSYVNEPIKSFDLYNEKAYILFQIETNKGNETKCLHRVLKEKDGFKEFSCDRKYDLSISEFVKMVSVYPEQYFKSFIPEFYQNINNNPFEVDINRINSNIRQTDSIENLWNTAYSSFVIKNINTSIEYFVYGNNGKISRNYRTKRIEGCLHSNKSRNDFFEIENSDDPVWILIKANYTKQDSFYNQYKNIGFETRKNIHIQNRVFI